MDWRTALTELLDLSLPVTAAIAAQPHLTLANAWDHPAVKIVRERLMSYLGKPSTIAELSEASEQLRTLHEELLRKDKLTTAELVRLGVLSGTAYVLSAKALAEAATPQALFSYTLQQVTPWLKRAADVAILAKQIISAARDLDSLDSAPEQAGADMLADLIAAQRVLSECLRLHLSRG